MARPSSATTAGLLGRCQPDGGEVQISLGVGTIRGQQASGDWPASGEPQHPHGPLSWAFGGGVESKVLTCPGDPGGHGHSLAQDRGRRGLGGTWAVITVFPLPGTHLGGA